MLWRRWVVLVAAGELAGFALPAAAGIWSAPMRPGAQLAVMTAAGVFEGAVLGGAQAAVLHRVLPGFRARAWVVATALAAALAWFVGMLPSTTHDTWSTWPVGPTAVVGVLLGAVLLGSIGTAQALVLPAGTRGARTWVVWTAVGWCAGLIAFTVISTPLWHPGQSVAARLVIGVLGGAAMALTMAAVTGVGAARLVARAHTPALRLGEQLFSTVLGTTVHDPLGHRLGRVADVVVDLDADLDRIPVTRVVIRTSAGERVAAPWIGIRRDGNGLVAGGPPGHFAASSLGPTDLLVRRDILDGPVVTATPPRRTRVSDVVVDIATHGAWVTGVDLSPAGALSRLLRRGSSDHRPMVPLSRVHLLSRHGHAAQLAAPGAMVRSLPPEQMAEVLTRVPVSHARDILRVVDPSARDEAVELLHPHVRARVTGSGDPPRPTRRLVGWRLHPPRTAHRSGDRG